MWMYYAVSAAWVMVEEMDLVVGELKQMHRTCSYSLTYVSSYLFLCRYWCSSVILGQRSSMDNSSLVTIHKKI